eukprot:4768438-Amphidinium_carterae.1
MLPRRSGSDSTGNAEHSHQLFHYAATVPRTVVENGGIDNGCTTLAYLHVAGELQRKVELNTDCRNPAPKNEVKPRSGFRWASFWQLLGSMTMQQWQKDGFNDMSLGSWNGHNIIRFTSPLASSPKPHNSTWPKQNLGDFSVHSRIRARLEGQGHDKTTVYIFDIKSPSTVQTQEVRNNKRSQ